MLWLILLFLVLVLVFVETVIDNLYSTGQASRTLAFWNNLMGKYLF
ncbi:MAG: hypothetical protein JEZ02_16260 [Desulfatibacillum sp.]|nr:hypothetical protein [Desulfatibacillum sp.]